MIKLKKCNIKNWDGSTITPLMQIKDRVRVKTQYLEIINNELKNKTINYRFHDEPSRIINELIRWCHGAMGMYSQTKTGCFYIENGVVDKNSIVEHTVTVADLVNLYFHKKINFGILLFFPVTLLSKTSNELLNNYSKNNEDIFYPFRRYQKANISNDIYTHAGKKVDLENYHLSDHFNLVRETVSNSSDFFNNELKEIFDFFMLDKTVNEFLFSLNH
jgi:hypothetical protein